MRATREMQEAARIARDDFLMHIDANDQIGGLNVALEAALEVAVRDTDAENARLNEMAQAFAGQANALEMRADSLEAELNVFREALRNLLAGASRCRGYVRGIG